MNSLEMEACALLAVAVAAVGLVLTWMVLNGHC